MGVQALRRVRRTIQATGLQPQPLSERSIEELVNEVGMRVRWAMSNLDDSAGAMLKLMEMRKGDPDLPDFGAIPGAWKNLDHARRAIEALRAKILHDKHD